eukprot:283521-Pleurochrysis_carterae.AAC.2
MTQITARFSYDRAERRRKHNSATAVLGRPSPTMLSCIWEAFVGSADEHPDAVHVESSSTPASRVLSLSRSLSCTLSHTHRLSRRGAAQDAEFLTRNEALPPERIRAVETGGCPHAAIREDVSANLAGVRARQTRRTLLAQALAAARTSFRPCARSPKAVCRPGQAL